MRSWCAPGALNLLFTLFWSCSSYEQFPDVLFSGNMCLKSVTTRLQLPCNSAATRLQCGSLAFGFCASYQVCAHARPSTIPGRLSGYFTKYKAACAVMVVFGGRLRVFSTLFYYVYPCFLHAFCRFMRNYNLQPAVNRQPGYCRGDWRAVWTSKTAPNDCRWV